jgi:hypothetical protein
VFRNPGDIKRQPSRNLHSTIYNEQKALIHALNEYLRTKDQRIIKTDKVRDTVAQMKKQEVVTLKMPYIEEILDDDGMLLERKLGEKKYNKVVTPSHLQLSKVSVDYMKMVNSINQHVKERLNLISIALDSIFLKDDNYITAEFAFKYLSEDFLTLPWLELLMIVKDGALIRTCDACGHYFFNARRDSKKVCSDLNCKPKSKDPKKRTENIRKRNAIIRKIQRGRLSIKEGNRQLKENGMRLYNPISKKESE